MAPQKNPFGAALLSAAIPGMGQVYSGHILKGLVYLGGVVGLEVFGFDLDLSAIGALVGIPIGLGGFALWAHGVIDAYRLAKQAGGPVSRIPSRVS